MSSSVEKQLRLARRLASIRPAIVADAVKWVMDVKRIPFETEVGIYWIDPATYLGNALMEPGGFESDLVELLRARLPADGTFLDIGANESYFTVVVALTSPQAKVVAVEPQNRMLKIIHENLRLNGLLGRSIVVENVALSDEEGTSQIHLSPGVNSGSSGLTRMTKYPLRKQRYGSALCLICWITIRSTRSTWRRWTSRGMNGRPSLALPRCFASREFDASPRKFILKYSPLAARMATI